DRIRSEMEKMFPHMRWCVYDPLRSEAQNFATQISFGDNLRLVPRIERADVILALDSDFLDCGEGDIASSRAFTSRRRVSAPKDSMNRLYVVENRYTLTGAMADHRMRLPASQIPLIAHAIAMKVATATKDAGLGSVLATLQVPAGAAQFNAPRALAFDPSGKTWIDWPELQKKVPDIIRLGYYEDETSALSRWNLPASHFLESWSDALSSEGHYLAIQPMILPLFGGFSELDLLTAVMGKPKVDGPELVQETFRLTNPIGDPATAWSKFLHDGFASHIVLRDHPP